MDSKVLVFELNEVPYKVIDQFVQDHPRSTFAAVLPRAARRHSHLPDTGQMHPKTSWHTFHRGVPDHVHGYREYNQIEAPGQYANPTFLELARRAGRRVGCGASIGSWPIPENHEQIDFWMADPFSPTPDSIPEVLNHFQAFNTAAVAGSSRNVRAGGFTKKAAFDFLLRLPALGIRPQTCLYVVRHLISERRDKKKAVRRRNIQALMSFDVCLNQWKRTKPHVATIFGNHVAAAMHRYWAAAFPNDYVVNNMPVDWREDYCDEIDAAMLLADDMLNRLIKAADAVPGTRVLVVGSMGQAAVEHEVTNNQLIISDMTRFLGKLGFSQDDFERRPGMEPEYIVAFSGAEKLKEFDDACERMNINGRIPHCKIANSDTCSILVDQYNVEFDHVTIDGEKFSLEDVGLKIESIDDSAGSTAQHIPEGICLVLDPKEDLSRYSSDVVDDLCAVTASILAAQNVSVPDYMPTPIDELTESLGGQIRSPDKLNGSAADMPTNKATQKQGLPV